MPEIPDASVDLTITDPPYGVGYSYDTYDDSRDNLKSMVDSFMPELLRISKVILVTCGNGNMWLYPKPDWILAWVIPAGTGMNKWGFTCWHPILAYGKDPYLKNKLGSRPDVIIHTESSKDYGHPCSKPIKFWTKLLLRGSVKETDIIFDPFLGSGTTAVAALNTGRNFIGIELSPEYCQIARKRIERETKQQRMRY